MEKYRIESKKQPTLKVGEDKFKISKHGEILKSKELKLCVYIGAYNRSLETSAMAHIKFLDDNISRKLNNFFYSFIRYLNYGNTQIFS